ncbi:uncharacterized protein LOC122257573 [Penaeus japonicus]|uniref:uncharacterized protein LOC122257573 n=1 Tax=Penaeus japonicus TaxID=27405 RepID=UPI001C70B968|nr:uncharacterized protein LOC122257573 [Penaeus japonicus]
MSRFSPQIVQFTPCSCGRRVACPGGLHPDEGADVWVEVAGVSPLRTPAPPTPPVRGESAPPDRNALANTPETTGARRPRGERLGRVEHTSGHRVQGSHHRGVTQGHGGKPRSQPPTQHHLEPLATSRRSVTLPAPPHPGKPVHTHAHDKGYGRLRQEGTLHRWRRRPTALPSSHRKPPSTQTSLVERQGGNQSRHRYTTRNTGGHPRGSVTPPDNPWHLRMTLPPSQSPPPPKAPRRRVQGNLDSAAPGRDPRRNTKMDGGHLVSEVLSHDSVPASVSLRVLPPVSRGKIRRKPPTDPHLI